MFCALNVVIIVVVVVVVDVVIVHVEDLISLSGECWSGKDGIGTYQQDGKSDSCIGKDYQPCKSGDTVCIGQSSANFVYQML